MRRSRCATAVVKHYRTHPESWPGGFSRNREEDVKALEAKGYTFASAEIEMVPQNYVTMSSEEDVKSMEKLLDMLDDNDDVQNVWHNWQQD